jgi:hypothetical protein
MEDQARKEGRKERERTGGTRKDRWNEKGRKELRKKERQEGRKGGRKGRREEGRKERTATHPKEHTSFSTSGKGQPIPKASVKITARPVVKKKSRLEKNDLRVVF